MADYLDLDITADSTQLADDASAWLESNLPGWQPAAGNLETLLIEATGRLAATIAVLIGRVPVTIFRYFGQQVLKVDSLQATAATGVTTWTLADTAGHVIPAGTQILIAGVGFETTTDVTVASGAGSVAGVTVVATVPGADGSGLSTPVTLVDTLTFVTAVTVTGVTTGGTDGETDTDYVNRLTDELPTLSPKAILLTDFEALARTNPSVDRALAIDNYVPAGPGGIPAAQTNVEGAVTVAVHDYAGAALSSTVKNAIASMLAGGRVLNLQVSVIDPTFQAVDVAFTAHCYSEWDPATVQASVISALQAFLSPLNWGQPALGQSRRWVDEPTVRRNDLLGVVYGVQGVRHVDTLTLALGGGTQATSDLTLPGPASLTTAGSVTGTVTT